MIESDIDRALFIKFLHKTCGFKILKDLVNGQKIIMDTWEAYHFGRCFNFSQTYTFNYSELEENYLIYNFPHTNTKLNLEYQTHLDFQDIEFFTTPTKYIIPYEIKKSVNESYWGKKYNTNAVNKILESNLKPQDCLITEIYLKTKGNSLENFLEYIFCKIFIDKGYMVENQIFFRDLNSEINIKIPDFGAYKLPEIQNMLINYGFIERGGFLYDLSFLRLRGRKNFQPSVIIQRFFSEYSQILTLQFDNSISSMIVYLDYLICILLKYPQVKEILSSEIFDLTFG